MSLTLPTGTTSLIQVCSGEWFSLDLQLIAFGTGNWRKKMETDNLFLPEPVESTINKDIEVREH